MPKAGRRKARHPAAEIQENHSGGLLNNHINQTGTSFPRKRKSRNFKKIPDSHFHGNDGKTGFSKVSPAIDICLILSGCVCIALLWLTPRSVGDLYMALAAGRDMAATGVGLPDDWSFTTNGRIWINQSWASHLLFYKVYSLAGEGGLLLLKLLLISLCVLFTALAANRKNVPWSWAFFICAFLFFLLYPFVDLRPNLVALACVAGLFWLIHESRLKTMMIWPAAFLVTCWAHLHGSVIYGVGMLAAWFLCQTLQEFVQASKPNYKRILSFGLAVPAAFLAGVWTSPYGLEIYRYTFSVGESRIWRSVAEWLPIWVAAPFGNVINYFCILICFGALLAFFLAQKMEQKPKQSAKSWLMDHPGMGEKLFDLILILMTMVMAFTARRFIPLSVLVLLPVFCAIAWQTIGYVQKTNLPWVINAAALITAFSCFVQSSLPWYVQTSTNGNSGSLYERMHLVNAAYPIVLANFINQHLQKGNLFCEWRWEGFFRWRCPQLKVYTGGRAQQIYDENTFLTYQKIISGQLSSADIASLSIDLIALPTGGPYETLIRRLNKDSDQWKQIFNDGRFILFVQNKYLL